MRFFRCATIRLNIQPLLFVIKLTYGGLMHKNNTNKISPRKLPKQDRSTDLVASILTAAAQVLEKEGSARFTTARVAEKAGVSIGSLYQYFPNKASILFQLQIDEWRKTSEMLRNILENSTKPLLERLGDLVHAFIRSECEEAEIRAALNDAAPFYRNTPEAQGEKESGYRAIRTFMREVLPDVSDEVCLLTCDLIITTFNSAGKRFSETPRTQTEIETYANTMADMFCFYLKHLNQNLACS
jgi:AcrR family transcriptional regulator